MKIYTVAHVPDELQQEWLQHLRNFDVAHPGCHFEVGIDGTDNIGHIIDRVLVEPELTFTKIFERTKWAKP